jgi:oxazoline/thiazoline synthase
MEDMICQPRLKSSFRCEIIPSEGAILLSERGQFLLRGNIYLHLAPLLDGRHTLDEIVDHLKHKGSSAAEVFYALELLRRLRCLVEGIGSLPPAQEAFWDLLGLSPDVVRKHLQNRTVSVTAFGQVDPAPLKTLLLALGIGIREDGDRCVVVTDDYLRDGLGKFNEEALTQNRPWLLIKPVGSELWFGPLIVPGHTACWTCLAHRLRGARKVESYLQRNMDTPDAFSAPAAVLPTTLHTAFSIAATEIAKWVAAGRSATLEEQIMVLDLHSLSTSKHILVRRPQCSSCGDSGYLAARQFMPLGLQSRKKTFTEDGGHRAKSPEYTLNQLDFHISPLTGIVSSLRPASEGMQHAAVALCYVTGHNFVETFNVDALTATSMYLSHRAGAAGKGKSLAQAKASALCESIERYSGVFQGDEARLTAKMVDLGDDAVPVNDCMLFSPRQFENRDQWNAVASESAWVPEPFDAKAKMEWSPLWSLTHNSRRYIPTAFCYYGYSQRFQAWFARADSNGCAAGHSVEEAILHGFMELVERDCVALWWYNRLQKPAVDLSSFDEPYFQQLRDYYQTIHRDLWVLDITSDLNIPSFAAVSRCNDQEREEIILGFGAHLDPRIAILRALTEVNQSLAAVTARPTDNESYLYDDPAAIAWWKTAKLKNESYLQPAAGSPLRLRGQYCQSWSQDLLTDVMSCVKIVGEKRLEVLVLDQTRPDTGLNVVKVFVPGLRHFWPRFARGRLYEVPVSMGWLAKPLTEDELNPRHVYF